jgi:hypothetical protein
MDVWIIAVVTDSPRNGPPIATLFAAEGATQQAAEASVRNQIGVPIHSITSTSLPPDIAMAFGMIATEVRRLL